MHVILSLLLDINASCEHCHAIPVNIIEHIDITTCIDRVDKLARNELLWQQLWIYYKVSSQFQNLFVSKSNFIMNDHEKHTEQGVHVYPSEDKRLIQLVLFFSITESWQDEPLPLNVWSQI